MLQYVQYNILHDVLFYIGTWGFVGFLLYFACWFSVSRYFPLARASRREEVTGEWPGSDRGVTGDNGNVAKCALTTACCPQQALDQHRIKLLSAVTKFVHPMIGFFSRQAKQRQVLSARKIFKVMDGHGWTEWTEAIWGNMR